MQYKNLISQHIITMKSNKSASQNTKDTSFRNAQHTNLK